MMMMMKYLLYQIILMKLYMLHIVIIVVDNAENNDTLYSMCEKPKDKSMIIDVNNYYNQAILPMSYFKIININIIIMMMIHHQ